MATNAAEAGLWVLRLIRQASGLRQKPGNCIHFTLDKALTYESFLNAIHPEDRERVDQTVQQAHQSGEPLQSDYRIVLPEGRIRWINARGQRYLKSSGEPVRLMGVSIDITARKQMEEQLQDTPG